MDAETHTLTSPVRDRDTQRWGDPRHTEIHERHEVKLLVAQSSRLCNTIDCSPPGSSVQGILQARILEWVAISYSRGFSQPRDQT